MHVHAAPSRELVHLAAARSSRRTTRRCRRRPTGRPRSRRGPARRRPRRHRTSLRPTTRRSPRRMWQLLVPMITTSVARRVTADGRSGDVRVDVRDRDRRARQQAGPRRRTLAEAAARAADGDRCARHLLVDDVLEARVERREVGVARGSRRLRPHRLVAGRAVVLRVSTPVSCQTIQSAASIRRSARRVDLGSLAQDLQRLREEPLGRDLAAVPRRARARRGRVATSLTSSASGWAAWCFQSFTHACGRKRRSGSWQSGVPSAVVGSIVHEVKSMPDADDVLAAGSRASRPRARRASARERSRRDPGAPSRARARHARRAQAGARRSRRSRTR